MMHSVGMNAIDINYTYTNLTTDQDDQQLNQTFCVVRDPKYDPFVAIVFLPDMFLDIPLCSPEFKSYTATNEITNTYSSEHGLDTKNRADLIMLARVRELGMYSDNWDGAGAQPPTVNTVNDSEKFIRLLPCDNIVLPHISLATDGEINFLWILPSFHLDLGFYGDGTYSFYGKTLDGKEYMEDEKSVSEPLPSEILSLINKS